jgi:hypothetical protein
VCLFFFFKLELLVVQTYPLLYRYADCHSHEIENADPGTNSGTVVVKASDPSFQSLKGFKDPE